MKNVKQIHFKFQRFASIINNAIVIEILILFREELNNHQCYLLSFLHGK